MQLMWELRLMKKAVIFILWILAQYCVLVQGKSWIFGIIHCIREDTKNLKWFLLAAEPLRSGYPPPRTLVVHNFYIFSLLWKRLGFKPPSPLCDSTTKKTLNIFCVFWLMNMIFCCNCLLGIVVVFSNITSNKTITLIYICLHCFRSNQKLYVCGQNYID